MTERAPPDPEALHAWLTEWVEAHNAHDIDGLVHLVDGNLVWIDPALFGQELVGQDSSAAKPSATCSR
jgi:ketosteroid isomerase-like protein